MEIENHHVADTTRMTTSESNHQGRLRFVGKGRPFIGYLCGLHAPLRLLNIQGRTKHCG